MDDVNQILGLFTEYYDVYGLTSVKENLSVIFLYLE